MRRRLEPYGGFIEWWVADYGKTRGGAPTIVNGPYSTRDLCEQAIRGLWQAPDRCPTCQSESRALMGESPCMNACTTGRNKFDRTNRQRKTQGRSCQIRHNRSAWRPV